MIYKNQRGFTLIEVMVVAGIIAILAGVLVPMIFGQIDESKKSRAQADIKSIATAISKFRMDTGAWPNRDVGTDPTTNTIQVIATDPSANVQYPAVGASNWPLTTDAVVRWMMSYFGPYDPANPTDTGAPRNYPKAMWKGPYLTDAPADPWGHSYLVGAKNFDDATGLLPVWIISAGPDGIIQTPIDSPVCYDGTSIEPASGGVTVGDDICQRFK